MMYRSELEIGPVMQLAYETVAMELILSGTKVTPSSLKKHCKSTLQRLHAELRAVQGTGFKRMHRAWGNEASANEGIWCVMVWILENKCKIRANDGFGYQRLDSARPFIPAKSCGACKYQYPVMKRCAQCRNIYYCSAECQEAHWNEHKLHCRGAECPPEPP